MKERERERERERQREMVEDEDTYRETGTNTIKLPQYYTDPLKVYRSCVNINMQL